MFSHEWDASASVCSPYTLGEGGQFDELKFEKFIGTFSNGRIEYLEDKKQAGYFFLQQEKWMDKETWYLHLCGWLDKLTESAS